MVDDDAEDRMLMQDMFAEIGAPDAAHYADSGETALLYLEGLTDNELPSVIVLDLNMPRLNGTQVLKILKQNTKLKHITVIMYSTSINNIEKEQSLKLGAHSYVIKPSSYNDCIKRAKYFNDLSAELSSYN
ncbi:response regulator [Parafilimonas sp.]|uniref:response regulator n=1 Tax=Parafilimonas sp. TaxID=1969739 RepID=UPI0039E295E3